MVVTTLAAAAAAVSVAAAGGTASGIRAADALFSALLGTVDGKPGSTQNGNDHTDDENIDRIHRLISFR